MANIQPTTLVPPVPLIQRGRFPHNIHCDAGKISYTHGRSVYLCELNNDHLVAVKEFRHFTETTVATILSNEYLAFGDVQGNVKIYSLSAGSEEKCLFEGRLLMGAISDICIDESVVGVVGEGRDCFINLFNWKESRSMGEFAGPTKRCNTLKIIRSNNEQGNNDCITVVVGSDDFSVYIYQGPSGGGIKLKKTLKDHKGFVTSLALDHKQNKLFTGGSDGMINIYNIEGDSSFQFIHSLNKQSLKCTISGLNASSAEGSVFSAGADGKIRLWNSQEELILDMKQQIYGLDNIDIDGSRLAVLLKDGTVSIIKRDFSQQINLTGHSRPIQSLTFNHSTKSLTSGDVSVEWSKVNVSKELHVDRDEIGIKALGDNCWINNSAQVFINGKMQDSIKLIGQPIIIEKLDNGHILVITTEKGFIIDESKILGEVKQNVKSACIHQNILLIATEDDEVIEYEISNEAIFNVKRTIKINCQMGKINTISISPDHKYAAIGTDQRRIQLINLSDFTMVEDTRWTFHGAAITCLAWSPNSLHLISGGKDDALMAWDPRSPLKPIVQIPRAHHGNITALCFISEDCFVSAGVDASLRYWKLNNEK